MKREFKCEICGKVYTTYNNPKNNRYCSRDCYLKRKLNTYVFEKDYVIGYTSKGEAFYFDLEDYEIIKQYSWHFRNGYPCTNVWKDNKRTVVNMHNLVTKTIFKNKLIQIDHISKERNDCRKTNLRIVDDQENARNRGLRSDNKSGVSGVNMDKYGKWVSRIQIDKNKRLILYRGDSLEEAIKSRLQAELEYFGEFAPQKHLFNQFSIKDIEKGMEINV